MQNFVPLGTGNSRLMKSNIPAGTTWEQAIAMLNSGRFPYDTGQLNAAGISVEGTPLNKQTLLQDSTAQQFGLTGDATVDQVLQILKNAAVVNSAGDALETILGSTLLSIPGVNIATGSYVGTGTYGRSNPNSLTVNFPPKFAIVSTYQSYNNYIAVGVITPSGGFSITGAGTGVYSVYGVFSSADDNTIQWYSNSASDQLNSSGTNYIWIISG